MKTCILLGVLSLVSMLPAQTFIKGPEPESFEAVSHGDIAFADVDGDGDQDVLITGANSANTRVAILYTNDGGGTFTEVGGTPFEGVGSSAIAFADVDGDGDQDVLVTGVNHFNTRISKLYTNDGGGIFTEVTGTPFAGVRNGAISFADVDGDGDQDVIITGLASANTRISKLYTNNGLGMFTEMLGTPFVGVWVSAVAFADVDGDGDQDVLIAGEDSLQDPISKLYINDGGGIFTEMVGASFEGVGSGDIAFADVDGDGDPDVLITGFSTTMDITRLYTNDGTGVFTAITDPILGGLAESKIVFADMDGDLDQDILLTGTDALGDPVLARYLNDGGGNFTAIASTPFVWVNTGSIAMLDIDGDNDLDVLISGRNPSLGIVARLYTNDGAGTFTEKPNTTFVGVRDGAIAFADVDGDGDQDILMTGVTNANITTTKLYINDGGGTFSEGSHTAFAGVRSGDAAFADVDGDGDQDVLITGRITPLEPISRLYTNDGGGNFTEVSGTPFEGVGNSAIAFADVDGDGDQDVLITGMNASTGLISKLYTNDGGGIFSEMIGTPFTAVSGSDIAFGDVDGDGDQDVLITGLDTSHQSSKLYTNDGGGHFTEVTGTPFEDIFDGSIAFADVDGDHDLDLLITGRNRSFIRISKLYVNDGAATFTEVTGTPFEGVGSGAIAFADVDGDGDQDVLVTGMTSSVASISKLYTNDGGGAFTEVSGTPFEGVGASAIAFADVDGDNDQDVFMTGHNSVNTATLYYNIGRVSALDQGGGGRTLPFMLYPNPAQSAQMHILFDAQEQGWAKVRVFDLSGRLVAQHSAFAVPGEHVLSMDIAGLPSGQYVVQVDHGGRQGVSRLVLP